MILAVSGFSRAGKDSIGQILAERHGFERRSFADPLKALAVEINPIVSYSGVHVGLAPLVEGRGWEWVKDNVPMSRVFLQRLGAGIRGIDEKFWIKPAFKGLRSSSDVVFTDCRYVNEAREVHYNGGKVIRVERPGFGPVNQHASEIELADWGFFDVYVQNDGSLEDLALAVGELMADWSW